MQEVGVEAFFDQIGALISGLFSLTQSGFDGVNQVVGLLIAVIAALVMPAWSRLWATALGAALMHHIIDAVRPMLDGGQFALPPILTLGFWILTLALFLGYAVVIAVFFLIKTVLTGGLHRRHRHAH
jgi:small-conductance mechanosensitive channel